MKVDRDLLDQFHRILVREIRKSNPEYFEAPFTVAEIYQHLVPYRTHREELGVEMNGQYEEAMMRLLAGEGEYLILDSEPASRKIRKELESPAPNTGLFREFAAAEVRLNPDRVVGEHLMDGVEDSAQERSAPAQEPDPQVSLEVEEEVEPIKEPPATESSMQGTAKASRGAGRSGKASPRAGSATAARPTAGPQGNGETAPLGMSAVATDDLPSSCPECTGALPQREGLRFCPHCGVNVHIVACAECDADLERSWNFCIYCGAGAQG